NQLVRAGLEVTDIHTMHAALEEGFGLTLCKEVVSNFFVVDVYRHCVERKELAKIHRDEYGHLRIGRKQQFLSEHEELTIEVENFLLERLDLLIQAHEVLHRARPLRERGHSEQTSKKSDQLAQHGDTRS